MRGVSAIILSTTLILPTILCLFRMVPSSLEMSKNYQLRFLSLQPLMLKSVVKMSVNAHFHIPKTKNFGYIVNVVNPIVATILKLLFRDRSNARQLVL